MISLRALITRQSLVTKISLRSLKQQHLLSRSFASINVPQSPPRDVPIRVTATSGFGSHTKTVKYTCGDDTKLISLPQPEKNNEERARDLLNHFLPSSYPHSVSPSYPHYATLQFMSTLFSSTSGVLSMQSLLYAVGLGAGSIPMAAALNWVLKDGLGQLGGVLFASYLGTSRAIDSNPKKWRFVSSLSMDASTLMEVCSPLMPGYFLAIASVANVGKNIAYLSASASRAALHNSMALKGNLADVTAKAGSQTILASMLGTGVGCLVSPIIGTEWVNVAMGFSVCSVGHLGCCWWSLNGVALRTINKERGGIIIKSFLENDSVPSPSEVARLEPFIPFSPKPSSWLRVGVGVEDVATSLSTLEGKIEEMKEEDWVVNVEGEKVTIAYMKGISGKDIFRSMLHGFIIKNNEGGGDNIVRESYEIMKKKEDAFLKGLEGQGWDLSTDTVNIECRRAIRLEVHPEVATGA